MNTNVMLQRFVAEIELLIEETGATPSDRTRRVLDDARGMMMTASCQHAVVAGIPPFGLGGPNAYLELRQCALCRTIGVVANEGIIVWAKL
jgi:hypothetical protein